MKAAAIALVFALLAPGLCLAGDAGKPPPSAALYDELVAKAGTGQPDVDYTLLRQSYVFTDHYDPYGMRTRTLFDDIWNAFQKKDCATVMAKSDELQKVDFTYEPIHAVRGECFKEAGDLKNSDREYAIGKGLSDSLLNSGDGKSNETAFVVVAMHEEGYVLASMERREAGQALLQGNGKMYDLIQATDEKGQSINVLFDVTGPFVGMSRQLENGKKPQ